MRDKAIRVDDILLNTVVLAFSLLFLFFDS